MIESTVAAAAFKHAFEARFASDGLLPAGAKQKILNFIDEVAELREEWRSIQSDAPWTSPR